MRVGHILVCHSVDPSKLFESIPHDDDAAWFVFFHGQDLELLDKVDVSVRSRQGDLFPYMVNRGLAKSWNTGIHLAVQAQCETILLLNDDLFFYEGAYCEFLRTIEAVNDISDNVSFISTNGLETGGSPFVGKVIPQNFACCALTTSAVDRVGYFDENFWPAYFEDVDYARRAGLLGMTVHIDPRTLVEHERSSTSRKDEDIRKNSADYFNANKAYFEKKWGGSRGSEAFNRPFGCATFDSLIPYERRNAPYGQCFDREDIAQWRLS